MSIPNKLIRRLVLSGNGSEIRNLLLTEQQRKLVYHIRKCGNVSTAEIAKKYNISSQNASSKLQKLYLKGYLKRDAITADTGGIEYIYKVNP